jgi:hypothetical protein
VDVLSCIGVLAKVEAVNSLTDVVTDMNIVNFYRNTSRIRKENTVT